MGTSAGADDAGEIGRRIRDMRKLRGFTQKQLALRVGVEEKSISRYENGRSRPSTEAIARLAPALGRTSDYLLYGQDGPPLSDQERTWHSFEQHRYHDLLTEPERRDLRAFAFSSLAPSLSHVVELAERALRQRGAL